MAVKLTRIEDVAVTRAWDYTLGNTTLEDINRHLRWAYVGSDEPLQATEEDVMAIWNGEPFSLKDGAAWLQDEYKDKEGNLIDGWLFVAGELMSIIKAFKPRAEVEQLTKYTDTAEEV